MSSFSLFPFCVVYVFRARIMCVLCNRYDARWISKTKRQNTRKWRNGGIKNPLFDALTYNTSGNFAHCSYFSAKYPRVLYVKPSNKVYVLHVFGQSCSKPGILPQKYRLPAKPLYLCIALTFIFFPRSLFLFVCEHLKTERLVTISLQHNKHE